LGFVGTREKEAHALQQLALVEEKLEGALEALASSTVDWQEVVRDLSEARDAVRRIQAPRRARILVIDDDEAFLRALRRALHDHDLVTCDDARAAVARLRNGERYDVIFCDVVMPWMDGAAFHAEVLVIAPEQVEAIVFVTGGPTTREAADFLSQPSMRVLLKPFGAEALREIIGGSRRS
jgi:CheY-like chemotaxis protein